jgi:predicted CDP-diglyceride synthetase/phosphatidate cytidylyltransferase
VSDWAGRIPPVDLALVGALGSAGVVALATRHRGGHFRGLAGWVGFWLVFAGILIGLSRSWLWLFLTLLGVMMWAALRTYFFLAPLRPRDRYAVLAAYAAVPFALLPAFTGSQETFLATVPIILFLVFPVLLSIGASKTGLLDSLGRTLLGVLLFVFCGAHVGMLAQTAARGPGVLELFGLLVGAAELPQRLCGRFGRNVRAWRAATGVLLGASLAIVVGFWAGPWVGLAEEDGARAGVLVALAVTMASVLTDAVARDLALGSSSARLGRGAFLDRIIPAFYAAPVFFHYLNHFA